MEGGCALLLKEVGKQEGVGEGVDFRRHKSTAKSRNNTLLRCWTKEPFPPPPPQHHPGAFHGTEAASPEVDVPGSPALY